MSTDRQDSTEGAKVIDEENRVDKRLKDRILDARERVAEREDACFVEAPLNDMDHSPSDLVQVWSTSVRQYLRTIEPLLRSDEISKSHHYYREIPILQDKLYPPDGKTVVVTEYPGDKDPKVDSEEIIWSLFYDDETNARDLVTDPQFEPPEPEPIELTGLKSIIETERIAYEWSILMNPSTHFSKPKRIARPKINRPLSKRTLENAVRKADRFLQQAGIGLEIGDPTREADADYSDIVDVDSLE